MSVWALNGELGSEARRYVAPLIFIAFVLGVPFGVGTAPTIFRDGDVSWHTAAGRWILEHHAIPRTDPFSFTAFGRPWIDTEWLAEIVYASGFNWLGYTGLAVVVAAALIALNAIIFFFLQRRASPLVVGIALLALDLVLGRFVLARPHVLAWPLLAVWTVLLLRRAEEGRPPSLWALLILPIWTNLHASFPLALIVGAAIGLDASIETRWKYIREWLVFGTASVAALCLNANGIGGVIQPFNISTLSMLPLIGEWRPSTMGNSPIFYAVFLCGLGALLRARMSVPIGRLVLLIVMLGLAFAHVRHQSSFAILAVCILPSLVASEPIGAPVPTWALIGLAPFLLVRTFFPIPPPQNTGNPWQLIEAVPAELRMQPVFNEYTFGGPLIRSGIKVYIDGRAEMYGDEFVMDYWNIVHGDLAAFQRAVQRYQISWAMLPLDANDLTPKMVNSGDWCRIHQDKIGMILVKKSGQAGSLCGGVHPN